MVQRFKDPSEFDEAIKKRFKGDEGKAREAIKRVQREKPGALKALRSGSTASQVSKGLKQAPKRITLDTRSGQRTDRFGQQAPVTTAQRISQKRRADEARVPQQLQAQIQEQKDAFVPRKQQQRTTTPTPTAGFTPTDISDATSAIDQELGTPGIIPKRKRFLQQQKARLDRASAIADPTKRQEFIDAINQPGLTSSQRNALERRIEIATKAQGPTTLITNADGSQQVVSRGDLEDQVKKLNDDLLDTQDINEAQNIRNQIRDIEEKRDELTTQFGRQEEIRGINVGNRLRSANRAVRDAKQRFAFLKGTQGFAQSEGALNAIEEHIVDVQRTADQVSRLTELERDQFQDDFDNQIRDLDQIITDSLDLGQRQALSNLEILDSRIRSGQISPAQADAETKRLMVNLATDFTEIATRRLEGAKLGLQAFDKKLSVLRQQKQDAIVANTIDVQTSNAIGDGIARNSQGAPITDDQGNPIRFDSEKAVQSVLKNPDGSTTILFKDGTHETQQFGLPVEVSEETVNSFAALVNRGQIDLKDVPPAFKEGVINKLAMLDPVSGKERFLTAGGGKIFDAQEGRFVTEQEVQGIQAGGGQVRGAISGVTPGGIQFNITAGTTNAIPDALNNPGDIKRGGTGDQFASRDAQGNLVLNQRGEGNFLTFDTPEQGFQALMADLNAKQTGRTRTRLNANSTLLDLAQVFANSGQTYANTVASTAGVDINTPIGQIDTFALARGVAKAEGFTGQISAGAGVGVSASEFSGKSEFEQRADIQLALSQIPTQLRNSDAEREIFEQLAKTGLAEGLTPLEIADRTIGFVINKEEDKQFANSLRGISFLSKDINAPKNIARAINDGNRGQAVKILENSILTEPDVKLEATSKTATQRVNELVDILETSGEELGPISGRLGVAVINFVSNEKLTDINNRMTQIASKVRNDLLGSAITPGEETAVEAILLKPTDSLEVALTKLAGVKREPLREYNNIRSTRGLPELDENQLLNQEERVNLYQSSVPSSPVQTQPLTQQSSDTDKSNALLKAMFPKR